MYAIESMWLLLQKTSSVTANAVPIARVPECPLREGNTFGHGSKGICSSKASSDVGVGTAHDFTTI